MRTVLSAVILLGALLDGVLGFGFLSNPAQSGANFGLVAAAGPTGAMGLSSMRADFTAFFLVAAGFMALGALRRRGDVLVAPLALFLVALSGRALNLLVVGPYDGWWMPMLVEAVHVAVLATAIRAWPWRGAGRIRSD